jgi:type III pantothenate kinase
VVHGIGAMVDGVVERIRGEIGQDADVLATGRLAEMMAPFTSAIHNVEPWLTLQGLRTIFEKNQP